MCHISFGVLLQPSYLNSTVTHRTIDTNISLPEDAYSAVGSDATFYCEVGSNNVDRLAAPMLDFEFSLPDEDGDHNSTKCTCWQWKECSDWSPNHLPTDIYIRPIAILDLPTYVRYRYEIRLVNVVPQLNGSMFSCSISTYSRGRTGPPVYFTQWKGSASLFVQGELPVTSAGVPSQSPRNYANHIVALSILINVFLLLMIATLFLVVAIGMWRWIQQRKYSHYELTQCMDNNNGTIAVPLKKPY